MKILMEAQQAENTPKLQQKTLTAMKLVEAGETPLSALQIVNNKDDITPQAAHLLKKKIEKYSLARPKIQKLVDSQAIRILKGKSREVIQRKVTKDGKVVEYKEVIPVTDTAITAVMGMSLERSQPVVKYTESVSLTISPVDLAKYRNTEYNQPDNSIITVEAENKHDATD